MTSLVAQTVKRLPTMPETWVRFLGQEDPPEKEMATHSSILAWAFCVLYILQDFIIFSRKKTCLIKTLVQCKELYETSCARNECDDFPLLLHEKQLMLRNNCNVKNNIQSGCDD